MYGCTLPPPSLLPTHQAYIPLVTVLLAISEQQFFLNYWHNFVLQILVQNIKVRKDTASCSILHYSLVLGFLSPFLINSRA